MALRKHRHDVLGVARKNKDALSKDEAFLLEEELTKQTKVPWPRERWIWRKN